MLTQSLGAKSSPSLKQGSRFDLEICTGGSHGHLPSLFPSHHILQTPVRHLVADTLPFVLLPLHTCSHTGFLAGLLAPSISLPSCVSMWPVVISLQNHPRLPAAPGKEAGALPMASRPPLMKPCTSSTLPAFPRCALLSAGWLFVVPPPCLHPSVSSCPQNCAPTILWWPIVFIVQTRALLIMKGDTVSYAGTMGVSWMVPGN